MIGAHRPGPARAGGLLLALLLLSVSAPVLAIGLTEAVEQGLSIHPSVAAAREEAEAAGADVAIARDGYWPTLQASAGPENSLWGEVGYDITASQMLYDWGRVSSRVEGASAVERQYLEAYKVTSDEAALDIVETYLDVLLFASRLAAVERYIERLEALAELSRDRSGLGYVDRGEAERAELELARAREQLSVERGSLMDARRQFRELLDRDPDGLEPPAPPRLTERLRDPAALEAAVVEAPLFRQASQEVEAARAEREESRASLKPQLNLEGSLQRREIGGRMEEDAVIALRLRMEAFQGLSNFRRVEAAGRRIEAARWSQRATRRDLRRALTTLIEQDEMLGWRLESLEAQLANAAEVADAYQEQFEVGLRDIDDLLPIQRDLFEAERQRLELESQQTRLQYRAATHLGELGTLLNMNPSLEEGRNAST
jgi:adhesin transport system outer membrane protein